MTWKATYEEKELWVVQGLLNYPTVIYPLIIAVSMRVGDSSLHRIILGPWRRIRQQISNQET